MVSGHNNELKAWMHHLDPLYIWTRKWCIWRKIERYM